MDFSLFKNFKKSGKNKEEDLLSGLLPEGIDSGNPVLEISDVIAPSALKINSNSINIGGKFARTLFVVSYPRFLTESWISPIINLDKIFNISIFAHPIDTNRVLRQLQKKLAEVQSQITEKEKKGIVRDPKLDAAYQDIERLRDQLQQSQEKLFDVGLYITIFADSEQELNKVESEIKSLLESKLIYLKPALFQQGEGFMSILPIETDELQVHSKLNSAPLSSFFPFVSLITLSPIGFSPSKRLFFLLRTTMLTLCS